MDITQTNTFKTMKNTVVPNAKLFTQYGNILIRALEIVEQWDRLQNGMYENYTLPPGLDYQTLYDSLDIICGFFENVDEVDVHTWVL